MYAGGVHKVILVVFVCRNGSNKNSFYTSIRRSLDRVVIDDRLPLQRRPVLVRWYDYAPTTFSTHPKNPIGPLAHNLFTIDTGIMPPGST